MKKHIILFLAANPPGTDRLALDREARTIQEALERSGHGDRFELETRWGVQPPDLLRELCRLEPTVVHFSGHGQRGELAPRAGARRDVTGASGGDASASVAGEGRQGLIFEGPDGRPQLVSIAALQEMFGAVESSVKAVVLSACYSEALADALLAHVDCVVGMVGSIRDDAARSFAAGLYGGLAGRQSLAAAYRQGCAAIGLDGLPDGDRPQLRVRVGVDAERLVLAQIVPGEPTIRDLLTRDLAGWGSRHVLGNLPRDQRNDGDAIPLLPLEELYVEPEGETASDDGQRSSKRLLELIEELTACRADPRIIVVMADLGTGKSLSARMLAYRWAKRCLESADAPLPVYVRCADDFPRGAPETIDLELTVQRAWRRQARSIGRSVTIDEPSLAWPSGDQHVVFLLDGLDEVRLDEAHVHALFQNLHDKTSHNHRFVIFSRPGVLPAERDIGSDVTVVQVQPFGPDRIRQWLSRWNHLHPEDPPIAFQDLAHGLATIAQTPILLFMIAFTWGQEATGARSGSIAEIYERFLYQIASGKLDPGPDRHRPIEKASLALLGTLRNLGVLDPRAERQDAMLWLMGRVAWAAHALEQRHSPEPLTRERLEGLLRDDHAAIPNNAVDEILDGLVLALQVDLHRTNHSILFGHKSFREFLVGRHWAITLRRLVRDGRGADSEWTTSLLEGRLLGDENNSFHYLMQLINATETSFARPAAPLGWRDEERQQLVRWAQETFENERQDFRGHAKSRTRADTALREDRRAELREAALAIGSMTRGSTGLRANDPRALRSMLAWFGWNGEAAIILAPRVALAEANLAQAVLRRADLRGADLRAADLRGANLSGANLSEAALREADLRAAQLTGADLRGADLRGAKLAGADLRGARLVGADLRGANLRSAKLPKADLAGADLSGADLAGADLRGADLRAACLRDVELQEADLAGADLSATDLSGVDFGGSNLTATIFHGADLSGARLAGADLREAKLGGASLLWADLLGTDLRGVEWDAATLWPLGFRDMPRRR